MRIINTVNRRALDRVLSHDTRTDPHENVRSAVSYELVHIIAAEATDAETREKALGLLDKQLSDPVVNVRVSEPRKV